MSTAPEAQETSASATDSATAFGAAYNPFDPAFCADPFPFYKRARAEAPVFHSAPFNLWVITRYDDIVAVLKDPQAFSSLENLSPPVPWPPEFMAVLSEGYAMPPTMVNNDPPGHMRVRNLFAAAFTPKRIALMEPRIRAIVDELITSFVKAGRTELIASFAYALPMAVICELLGVPAADREKVKALHDEWILSTNPALPLERLLECAKNIVAYQRYYAAMIEDRRANPKDDLTTAMVQVRIEGETPLTMPEMILQMMVLLSAGHETTTNLISNSLLMLLTHPDAWSAVRADPCLIPAAIEETLRAQSPQQMFMRVSTRDVELGGQRIPKGARVIVVFASGNRDAKAFGDPDTFDIRRRDESRHLAFGHGIHFCIGAPLARLEGRIALEELIRSLPNLRLADGFKLEYPLNFFFRGPKELPLEWDAT